MLIVLRKVDTTNPTNGKPYFWSYVTEYQNEDDATDERLRSLGPGELKVLKIDPDSAVSVSNPKDPLVRYVEVPPPAKPPKLKEIK